MDDMLRKALRKHRELRNQFENCLLGEEGNVWEAEAKRFLTRRPCWIPKSEVAETQSRPTPSKLESACLLPDLDWARTYEVLGLSKEYQAYSEQNPEALVSQPNRWVTPVIQGLSCAKLVAGYRQSGIDLWSYTNDLDADVPKNERHPNAGSYVESFLKTIEADPGLANKSANDLTGTSQITLLERLLLGLAYFLTTGQHLDQDNITLCVGSRYSDGLVPGVDWDRGRRKVYVHWYRPRHRFGSLRSRPAV